MAAVAFSSTGSSQSLDSSSQPAGSNSGHSYDKARAVHGMQQAFVEAGSGEEALVKDVPLLAGCGPMMVAGDWGLQSPQGPVFRVGWRSNGDQLAIILRSISGGGEVGEN